MSQENNCPHREFDGREFCCAQCKLKPNEGSDAFLAGMTSYTDYDTPDNPYPEGTQDHLDWEAGMYQAHMDW